MSVGLQKFGKWGNGIFVGFSGQLQQNGQVCYCGDRVRKSWKPRYRGPMAVVFKYPTSVQSAFHSPSDEPYRHAANGAGGHTVVDALVFWQMPTFMTSYFRTIR